MPNTRSPTFPVLRTTVRGEKNNSKSLTQRAQKEQKATEKNLLLFSLWLWVSV
jgi:hypothetical protein